MSPTSPTSASPRRIQWLETQLAAWTADGLVGADQARAIRARYTSDTRSSVVTLLAGLGALFLGVGLLWLVATNVEYDHLSPAARFGAVALLWLGFTVGGLTVRRFGGPLRLLAALLFGGVVFQAAQSLHVPAYEPGLLLAWSAGALALAYGARSSGPLVIGAATGVGWYLWVLGESAGSMATYVLGVALATPVLAAAAAAHRQDRMGAPWLRMACLTALLALFLAAFPGVLIASALPEKPLWAAAAAGLAAVTAAAARATRRGLAEMAGAVAVAAAGWALVATAPEQRVWFWDAAELAGADLGRAFAASLVFLLAAVGVAVTGVVRGLPGLVNFAAVALVLFVTLQSFGLFAPLLSGAGLFLLMGVVLTGSALLVNLGRRRLRKEIGA